MNYLEEKARLKKEIRKELIEIHNHYMDKKMDNDGTYAIDIINYCQTDDDNLFNKLSPFVNFALEIEGIGESSKESSDEEVCIELRELKSEIEKVKRDLNF